MQQQFSITYADQGKRKLQTSAVTPRRIQPPTWKKTRVESPAQPSYHYISKSAINFLSVDITASLWEVTKLEKEQEKQEKEESEDQKFTYQNPILENLEVRTLNVQTLRSPNLENPEIETLNIQAPPNQNNPNPEIINQHLPPNIVINHLLINLIVESIQQPPQQPNLQIQQLQGPPQQLPKQQQLLQQSQQQLNVNQMAYAPIAKLENFTGKEDNAQA
ncbi:hypothetical protein G9A89_000818 [Geosiphon pyriformis]|nr:hypothetical protein G9A89_000818 [Geosiphon pyriformis]